MVKKILLVDDEPHIVKTVAARLEAAGYEVTVSGDGKDALDRVRDDRPDLVLLDLMLPKMDGYKVCGLMKTDSRYRDIPVILFTARAQEKDKEMGKEVGADAYITKPFQSEMVVEKIAELLKVQA